MLRTLFPRNHAVYEGSRFGRELAAFGTWLLTAGYSRENTCHHLRRLRQSLESAANIDPDTPLSAGQLRGAFVGNCTTHRCTALYRGTQHAYERFLADQDRLLTDHAENDPRIPLLDQYRLHLTELRGFASCTIQAHVATVWEFLGGVLRSQQRLCDLTRAHVEQYLLSKSKAVSRQSFQHNVAHLRSFLRFVFARGLIPARLDVIDTPRTYRDELPPRALPWPLVMRLLRSIDRSSKAGWRDFAILHLMAHYGLRPSEIVAVRLDSIDWHEKTLRVEQRKTRSTLVLPLADRTLALLRRYIRQERSHSGHPHLFVRVRRPSGSLKHTAVCDIFQKRAREAGIPSGYSSYSLRHAFAMRLLTRGVGLKTIGDLLGHRSFESTCVYLRLDTEALRTVALPLPRAARAQGGRS
jgi:integrase/recombinase XerD